MRDYKSKFPFVSEDGLQVINVVQSVNLDNCYSTPYIEVFSSFIQTPEHLASFYGQLNKAMQKAEELKVQVGQPVPYGLERRN